MKVLFICDTPLQVLNSMNIDFNGRYDADFIIVDQFRAAKNISKELEKTRVTAVVALLKKINTNRRMVVIRKFLSAYCMLFSTSYLRKKLENSKYILEKNRYDAVAASVFTPQVMAILRLNPKAKFWLIDDGLASYTGNIMTDFLKDINLPLRLIYSVFYRNDFKRSVEALYLNNPEYCNNELAAEIKKIPNINEGLLNIIYSVFPRGRNYNQRIVWFSVPLGDEKVTRQIADRIKRYKDEVVVRMHPRDNNNLYEKYFEVDYAEDLWEIKVASLDIENKVLISLFSTAQTVPKYFYNKEPVIILLYKIYGFDYDKLAKDVISIYSNKNRVLIPESVNELNDILERLRMS